MANWLEDVKRLESERDIEARERKDSDDAILAGTVAWMGGEVRPALERFAQDLRSIDRVVIVEVGETVARVDVKDPKGLVSEYVAEIGTKSTYSTKVQDKFPAMSAVFYGLDRSDVGQDRIYEILKQSYLSGIKTRRD